MLQRAKAAYCSSCGATNASDCANFFQPNGAGYDILLNSDDVATMASTTWSSTCDPVNYGICVALAFCGPSGGDYCTDGGLCAPH